jgi:TonB family protein
MPPTAKDLEFAKPNAQSPAGNSGSGKTQPVALEIPVTVNGARTVEGSDKREPFSETTQTVLVFGNGAVIRLSSSVTPGQLLFLTNEKTKKEVVCQVLKSRNYSNVSGYVELEFTETVSGFWGVRFAPEGPSKASAPAAAPVASASKIQTPASVNAVPRQPPPPAPVLSAAKAESLATSTPRAEVKFRGTQPPSQNAPTSEIPKASVLGSDVTGSRSSEVKAPASSPAQPAAKTSSMPANSQANLSAEALKRESARLQEQLSAMLFNTEPPTSPAANKQASADAVSKVIELSKSQSPATKTISPANSTGCLDAEEVKIPSWLEPLARNAATPAHNDLTAEPRESDDGVEYEVQDLATPANSQELAVVPSSEAGQDVAVIPENSAHGHRPGKNKTVLIAAAAAGFLLLAAGTTWYLRQSPSASSQASITAGSESSSTAAVQRAAKSAADASAASASNSGNGGNFSSAPSALPTSAAASQAINSQTSTPTAQPLKGASDRNTTAELSAYRKLAEPPQPVDPQPKRSGLGKVRLSAPTAARRPTVQDAAGLELAPAIGHVAPAGDALGGGLAGGGSKPLLPSAPLPVGGDVKQAKLISSTPPLYPVLAKTQHIEGNVRVDALVDENGRISAMKVISGPTLLHQAAMDAVRQWKYQPATLDGKTVPMHLTVTLQFKLQ